MHESESQIVRRLVENQHLDVPSRQLLPGGRASLALVIGALVEVVSESGSYPKGLGSEGPYAGRILVRTAAGYEIHHWVESGMMRFLKLSVERFVSLDAAARAYALNEWPRGIDGIPITAATNR
jgi:hypothetical protein